MRIGLCYRTIFRFEGKYPLGEMCRFFKVSYSGYYKWRKRQQKPDRDTWGLNLIQERYKISNNSAGYRQITDQLRIHYGLRINHKAIYRITKKFGIQSVSRRLRPYIRYSDAVHRYENVLNRDFKADKPNQKWVTDITYIHTKQGVLYLSAIKDLYDGYIVHYKTGTDQSIKLVTMTVQEALKKEKVAGGLALHSDQGFQYSSHAYFRLTQEYDITPSMSRRGNCLDNACMENFFGMLKSEWIQRRKFTSIDEARRAVDQYIHYYNYERCNLKTKLTPYLKRCQSA
ncbi:IS3 family transposase [Dendrosporobacter sp. 1207_IL3150]|uniref:IS3 family transposase n=1 Tax=Dendrosporobacter sp. 1207_IL3150 TaxID=3084054 RepID=UPI002FDAB628